MSTHTAGEAAAPFRDDEPAVEELAEPPEALLLPRIDIIQCLQLWERRAV